MEAFPAEGFGPRGRGSRGGGESRRGRGGRGRGSGGTGGSPSVGGGRGRGRRGSSPVRGGRGRGGPVVWCGGGQATSRGGAAPHRLLPTEIFFDPLVGPCLPLKGHRWIIIRNLPVLRVQDSHTLCDFIAQLIHVKVHKLWFKVPTNECQRLAALSLFPSPSDCYTCIEKLHGQVYHNHRLLVGGYKVGAGSTNECFVTENCIKITNLSKAVTVDTLWNCFENCGQLGMIYLRPGPGDGKVEALVNFEDSDSVMNALKLNGATLDETIMEVVYLDWKLSVCVFPLDRFPDGYLASILKDVEGVTHVEYAHKQSKSAQVFLSDETSYSVALNLDRQCLNGNYLSVKPPTKLLYLIPSNIDLLDFEAFSVVLNTSKVTPHPRKRGVLVLHFYTQSDADAALQSSPVLINGQSLTLYDSVSKVSSTMAKLEVTGAEDEDDKVSTELDGVVIPRKHPKEMGNYEKMLNESEELRKKMTLIKSLERAAKATSPFEGQQNQLLSKRKRNNTKTLKKSKKEKK